MLLARLGIGQLVLFDDDIVEASNLNRLHGRGGRIQTPCGPGRSEVVAREIAAMGIGYAPCHYAGGSTILPHGIRLKACDVIFGCTDDHDGRLLLNQQPISTSSRSSTWVWRLIQPRW